MESGYPQIQRIKHNKGTAAWVVPFVLQKYDVEFQFGVYALSP